MALFNIRNKTKSGNYLFLIWIGILIQADIALCQRLASFHAQPDQVLVLYNADWTRDVYGSVPGQDSKEVAEYYQSRHTDPVNGKKPYLLGLGCNHKGKFHLNDWKLTEQSQDNKDGIIFSGEGPGPNPGEWVRDSRRVEIIIGQKDSSIIDWSSVSFYCRSRDGRKKRVTDISVSGIPKKQNRRMIYPEIKEEQGRCYRFDAHNLFRGTVWVHASAKDQHGHTVKDMVIQYYDRDDFRFSEFGPDGITDEKHFQEDVAIPVKKFLEDPDHALSDGTLLKDHILYILICHGLPFACEGVFGIERGVTSRPPDHGDLGAMEQRLQTLYYGWGDAIKPPVISLFMSGGPKSREGIRNYRITSGLRYPLCGRHWHPYMHPDTYSYLGKHKTPEFIHLKPFGEERRQLPPALFAYGVTRIDGQGPREAKRIIDYSVYASKFLRPEMQTKKQFGEMPDRLNKVERNDRWGKEELSILGFDTGKKTGRWGLPFFAKEEGYYPGGMARTVVSGNGWNMGRNAPIWNQIDHGVTVSACGGPAYGGGPHITNATFWDNRILMRYLFRGRDLGECFLRSTYYVNWSTSLVGDPLYHPDLYKTRIDTTPPNIELENVRIDTIQTMGHYSGIVKVPVKQTPQNPELCLLKAVYGKTGSGETQQSTSHIYSARPYVYLRHLDPDSEYTCSLELVDPYGNKRVVKPETDHLIFRTGKPFRDADYRKGNTAGKSGNHEISLLKMKDLRDHGTLKIDFSAGKCGIFPGISSGNFYIKTRPWNHSIRTEISLAAPKKTVFLKSPLKPDEKAALVIRWRRFPLTREIALVAGNGEEYLLTADTRTPWEKSKLKLSMKITAGQGIKILSSILQNDGDCASQAACKISVPEINPTAWSIANHGKSIR